MGTLHLLGALFVMYGHQCSMLQYPGAVYFGNVLIHAMGVKIIFLISGYLIVKSLMSDRNGRVRGGAIYCIKRLGRIYPELLVCLLITALVIGPLFSTLTTAEYFADPLVSFYIRRNLALFPVFVLPGVFLENPYYGAVNGSLWTIPVEIAMYLLILLIFLCARGKKARKIIYTIITVFVVVGSILRFALAPASVWPWYGTDWAQALNIAPYFLIGGLAYFYDIKKYLSVQKSAFLFLAFAAIPIPNIAICETLCMFVISYFILSLMLADNQNLKLKFIKGEYAYGMYLWGFPVQQCVVQKLFVEQEMAWHPFVYFCISAVITYLIAMVSYHVVYEPVSKLIRMAVKAIAKEKTI